MAPRAAKKNDDQREPVTERGADLLQLILDAQEDDDNSDGGLRLTQTEAQEAIAAGYAQVDEATYDEASDTAVVTLTDAGHAMIADGSVSGSGTSTSNIEIDTDVAMPAKRTRKSSGPTYPINDLQPGHSFHIPATEDNPNPAIRLAAVVAKAREEHSEPLESGETETKTTRTYKRDADGEIMKDENGKRVIDTEETVTVPKMRQLREFKVFTVNENDPKGAGARVFRVH